MFPHKNNVEEARAKIDDLPDTRPQHVGDTLDPENEQDNAEQEEEGVVIDTTIVVVQSAEDCNRL